MVINESYHSCDLLHKQLSIPRPEAANKGKQPLVVHIGGRSVHTSANFVRQVDQRSLQCEEQLVVRQLFLYQSIFIRISRI